MQSRIHLFLESHRAELLQWLQSRFDITTSIPQNDFSLCLTDFQSLDRISSQVRRIKQGNPQLYMPVLLLVSRDDILRIDGHYKESVDEVVLEPVVFNEMEFRIDALLKSHEFSLKAQKLQQNQTKLQLQAQRLANLSENVPGMLFQFAVLHDGTRKFEYISEGIKDIFGIEPEEGLKDPMKIIGTVHPNEINLFLATLNHAVANHQPLFWHGRYIINGKTKWLRNASTPHVTNYGETWDGVIVDVTAFKEAEDKIRDLAKFNEQIIENTHEGLVVCDTALRITKWNRSMEKISGLPRERVIGQHPLKVFSFFNTEEKVLFEQALEGKRVQTGDYPFEFTESGARGWAQNTHVPLRNAKGEIIGVLCAVNEITARKKFERELRKTVIDLERTNEELKTINTELETAYERLKDIDKAKTEFVSTASHEIRTPLAGILGYVQTILSPDLDIPDKKEKEYLQIIESETRRLNELVNTMLNISRLDAGKQKLQLSSFSLSDLVRATIAATFSKNRNEVLFKVTEKDRGLVQADKQQIGLVIQNILCNAIRYTPVGGEIDITIDIAPGKVIVSVKDQGPGIPADKLEVVFEKFYRIKEDTSTSGRGSGLGLSIAREIIKAHHGEIWAESVLGEGSTFYFTLPVSVDRQ